MRADLGLTIAQAALPLNVFRALSCILLIPAGQAIDKLGAYRILFPGLVAGAALGLLLPMATNLSQLVILQALFAVSKLVGGLATMQVVVMETFQGAPDVGSAQAVTVSGWSAAGLSHRRSSVLWWYDSGGGTASLRWLCCSQWLVFH